MTGPGNSSKYIFSKLRKLYLSLAIVHISGIFMKGTSKDLLNVNFLEKKAPKLRVFLSKKICDILRR